MNGFAAEAGPEGEAIARSQGQANLEPQAAAGPPCLPTPFSEIVADIRAGRLRRLELLSSVGIEPIISALRECRFPLRIILSICDKEEMRPVMAAAAPFVESLRLFPGGTPPKLLHFPFMPQLESLITTTAVSHHRSTCAEVRRIVKELLLPHAGSLRHLVLCRIPLIISRDDDCVLSGLADVMRAMPRLESLAVSPHDLDCIRRSVGATLEPLAPLPAGLRAMTVAVSRSGTIPSLAQFPRSLRHVALFHVDGTCVTPELVRSLFETLPDLERADDRLGGVRYQRDGAAATTFSALPLPEIEIGDHGFDGDADRKVYHYPRGTGQGHAMGRLSEISDMVERLQGGWDSLALTPGTMMEEIPRGAITPDPDTTIYTYIRGGGLREVRRGGDPEPEDPALPPFRLVESYDTVSPLTEAARRCPKIAKFKCLFWRTGPKVAAATAAILLAHPEIEELVLDVSEISDEAVGMLARAIGTISGLRRLVLLCDSKDSNAPLERAVLGMNAWRRLSERDRAQWDVVRRGCSVRPRAAGRAGPPWHLHSVGGRIADFVGPSERIHVSVSHLDETKIREAGWLVWFMPDI
jgi:hypothetical protein